MEKDYFKDRPVESTHRKFLYNGDEAIICLKAAQKYASDLKHLTRITITEHLTSQDIHPRGIKFRGYCYSRDDYGNLLVEDYRLIKEEVVGRCVYPIKNDLVLTKDGYKAMAFENNVLLLKSVCDDVNNMQCVMEFGIKNYSVSSIISPYNYVSEDNLESSLCGLNMMTAVTDGKYVFIQKNDGTVIANMILETDFPYFDGELIRLTPLSYYGLITNSVI